MHYRDAALVVGAALALAVASCDRGVSDQASTPPPVAGTSGAGGAGTQPGTGLQGGLGTSATQSMGAAGEGSKNTTRKSSTGNRP